jgi:hypothetical protein
MTTRRGFLGALVAAPIAAPALAKEALAPRHRFASGGLVRGMGKTEALSLSVDTSEFRFLVDRFEIAKANCMDTYYRAVTGSDGSAQVVPNRLYGAEINQQGEAI